MPGVQKHPRYRVSLPVDVITPAGDVMSLAIEDISLGGVFIRTDLPPPAGSFVRMRLPVHDRPLALMGRVVHVIDEAQSVAKARAPGIGVQFDGLAPISERLLARFVAALVDEERRRRAAGPRFVDDTHVDVPSDRASLARVWTDGLERGVLVGVRGAARLGNRVEVQLGPLTMHADVIEIGGGGGAAPYVHDERDDDAHATLRVVDLSPSRRAAIERFLSGELDALTVDTATSKRILRAGPPNKTIDALSDARRLFRGVEAHDPFAAVDLPRSATSDEVTERVRALHAAFTDAQQSASAPQRARLAAAADAVLSLEHTLLAQSTAVVVGALIDDGVREQVKALVSEAEFLERVGQPREARHALEEALALAPDDDDVKERLAGVALDEAEALSRALSRGSKDEAVERVRVARSVSSSRAVLLRAMRLLATAGAHDDVIEVAQRLADLDPRDELPLRAMLQLHERAGRFGEALRAGEALLRLRPEDLALQERVGDLAARARAS